MHQRIIPIMIACGIRYVKTATVSISTFLQHHPDDRLFVAADEAAIEIFSQLSFFENKNLHIINIQKYAQSAINRTGNKQFSTFKYDNDGNHDRTYSALKIVIMDEIVNKRYPDAEYILSLDADTLFTGNILKRTSDYLSLAKHKFEIYMIQRDDPRMMLVCDLEPGSGYTLWKRDSGFVELFISRFNNSCVGLAGGSQILINQIKRSLLYHEIDDPLLHFISPDSKNPNITNEEILKIQPAYIHLHGKNSYARLLNFKYIFSNHQKNL